MYFPDSGPVVIQSIGVQVYMFIRLLSRFTDDKVEGRELLRIEGILRARHWDGCFGKSPEQSEEAGFIIYCTDAETAAQWG